MPKSSIDREYPVASRSWFAFEPSRSGTLLVIALLVALGFILIIRPMMQDGLPGDYETRRGDILLTDGAYQAAIAEFDRALAVSPSHRGAIMGRAIALMESGQSAAAEAEFGRLIALLTATREADDRTGLGALAAAYANRGILRDRAGRTTEALDDYRRALQVDADAVKGPGLIDRVLYGTPRASTIAKRASYLEAQLALPREERRLSLPERDAEQRMHKP
ncbi:MAG: tetratricopeptide repeat protein [Rhodospirillales bacterium]